MTAYDVTIFGIKLTLHPVAFSIPLGSRSWDIYWYGIIIATGFLLALIYGMRNAPRFGLNTDRMLDVILVATPVAILSARTYYVLFDGEKLTSVADFFGFGSSSGFAGIAIYGGIIGAFVSGAIMCKIRKVNILDMFDVGAIGFLIGQGIGRWGNFVNQEAYGTFTGSSWWGMESTRTISEMGKGLVHPCFLYESVWCIAGVLVLHHFSKKRAFKGEIILLYGVWYGFERAIIELLRTDSLMLGKIRVSSLLSVLLCLGCATTIIVLRRKLRENAHVSDYGAQFMEQSDFEKMEAEISPDSDNNPDVPEKADGENDTDSRTVTNTVAEDSKERETEETRKENDDV